MRIDKYLHNVRYFKTRSLATEFCRKNHVKVNDEWVKPSKEIMIGDKIGIKRGPLYLSLQVIAMPENRVGAKQVGLYVVDNTPKQTLDEMALRRKDQNYYREKGEGRPTKKDRREIDDFLEEL